MMHSSRLHIGDLLIHHPYLKFNIIQIALNAMGIESTRFVAQFMEPEPAAFNTGYIQEIDRIVAPLLKRLPTTWEPKLQPHLHQQADIDPFSSK